MSPKVMLGLFAFIVVVLLVQIVVIFMRIKSNEELKPEEVEKTRSNWTIEKLPEINWNKIYIYTECASGDRYMIVNYGNNGVTIIRMEK